MRYSDYYDCDICNGKSVGMSLFVQGCPLHCNGCFNPETWDFNSGEKWTKESENNFITLVGRDYIRRISILGGSPLCQENIKDVSALVSKIRDKYPEKQIWIYTGYTWETLMSTTNIEYRNDILDVFKSIDVLVDGEFMLNQKDLALAFRGSTNQRIIDVQSSLKTGEIVLWNT